MDSDVKWWRVMCSDGQWCVGMDSDVYRDRGGGGAGRAAAPPLFCAPAPTFCESNTMILFLFFDFQCEKIIFNCQPSHLSPCFAVPGVVMDSRDRAEGGAGGALAPPLFYKNKNKLNKK